MMDWELRVVRASHAESITRTDARGKGGRSRPWSASSARAVPERHDRPADPPELLEPRILIESAPTVRISTGCRAAECPGRHRPQPLLRAPPVNASRHDRDRGLRTRPDPAQGREGQAADVSKTCLIRAPSSPRGHQLSSNSSFRHPSDGVVHPHGNIPSIIYT